MILENIEKTQDELNKDIANEYVSYLNQVVEGTDNRIKELARRFWENPQVISEALGSNTGKLFMLLGSLETLLSQYDESYVKFTVPYEYTVNKDGSVTIGDKIEVEETNEETNEIF